MQAEARQHNWMTDSGGVSTVGVELLAEAYGQPGSVRLAEKGQELSPEGVWMKRIWLTHPPIAGAYLRSPVDADLNRWLMRIDMVECLAYDEGKQALEFGTYRARGRLVEYGDLAVMGWELVGP